MKLFVNFYFAIHLFLLGVVCHAGAQSSVIYSVLPNEYRVVFEELKDGASVEWVVSSIKKVNGRWRYETSASMIGDLLQQTYEFNDVDRAGIAKNITQLAEKNNWEVIFECKGLSCGRSYGWGEVFANKMLHGIDDKQNYWVWKSAGQWFSGFLIERANRRVYLQWLELRVGDNVTSKSQPVSAIQRSIVPYAVVVGAEALNVKSLGSVENKELTNVVDWLKKQGFKNVAIVGHNQVEGLTFADQQSQSLSHAKLIQDFLRNELPDVRFKIFGLGPLAPRDGFPHRVEVLPISE